MNTLLQETLKGLKDLGLENDVKQYYFRSLLKSLKNASDTNDGLKDLNKSLVERVAKLERDLMDKINSLLAMDTTITDLREAIASKDDTINQLGKQNDEYEDTLIDRGSTIAKMNDTLCARDRIVSNLREQISDLGKRLASLRKRLTDKDISLDKVLATNGELADKLEKLVDHTKRAKNAENLTAQYKHKYKVLKGIQSNADEIIADHDARNAHVDILIGVVKRGMDVVNNNTCLNGTVNPTEQDCSKCLFNTRCEE